MTIDNVLEILEKHKLRIPSNVFYELKADIVNFEDPTTKNNLEVDCVSRKEVEKLVYRFLTKATDENIAFYEHFLDLPSVTPQEPRCKNCKWWKDSDGEYRRGCGAESQCPINRREVFEGNGYCFLFEPQESEDRE